MADKLEDTTPLVGISDDDTVPAHTGDDQSLLGRIINPTPQQERGVQSDQGDQPTFGSVLLNTVTGNEGREPVNPDADDGTTDNSQA